MQDSKKFSKVSKQALLISNWIELWESRKKRKRSWATNLTLTSSSMKRDRNWKTSRKTITSMKCPFNLKVTQTQNKAKTLMHCTNTWTSSVRSLMHRPKITVYNHNSGEWKTRRVSLIWRKMLSARIRARVEVQVIKLKRLDLLFTLLFSFQLWHSSLDSWLRNIQANPKLQYEEFVDIDNWNLKRYENEEI